MVKVQLTANLQKYYPQPQFEMESHSLLELLQKMDEVRPHFSSYVLEDNKHVRKHVNIFINGELLPKNKTDRSLKNGDTVHIMQALSGG